MSLQLLTTREVAQTLRIGINAVADLGLPRVMLSPKKCRYRSEDIQKLIASKLQKQPVPL